MFHKRETAILAGGCFWGMQDLIRKYPGVISTRVGYTGGDNDNATYLNHPGHAEAIEIIFDPEKTSFRDLLEFFFQVHDPTTRNRQGWDIGSSYRSAIFYTSDKQRHVCRGHHRGRRRLRPVARQGRDRGDARWPVLGGGTGAPGLPAAPPRRLHVPLRPRRLEAPQAVQHPTEASVFLTTASPSEPPALDIRRADTRLPTRLMWLDSRHSFSSDIPQPRNTHHGLPRLRVAPVRGGHDGLRKGVGVATSRIHVERFGPS